MLHKFLLTSVIIFVKPGTTAQLAAAFVINLAFLVLHVQTQAFMTKAENDTQFNGLISIALTLFSGILLKYDELSDESDDPYNKYTLLVVLMGSQAAVAAMFMFAVACPEEREQTPLEMMQEKLSNESVNEAMIVVMDRVREQQQDLLDGLELTVTTMVEEAKIEPELGQLFGLITAKCREMDTVSACFICSA